MEKVPAGRYLDFYVQVDIEHLTEGHFVCFSDGSHRSRVPWDSTTTNRKFAFSKLSTGVKWESDGALTFDAGVASVLAVFVKIKE